MKKTDLQREADRLLASIIEDHPAGHFSAGVLPLLKGYCWAAVRLPGWSDLPDFAERAGLQLELAQRLRLTPNHYIDRRSHQRHERGDHPELGGHAVREDK